MHFVQGFSIINLKYSRAATHCCLAGVTFTVILNKLQEIVNYFFIQLAPRRFLTSCYDARNRINHEVEEFFVRFG